MFPEAIFITGTDTGVGKTLIAAALTLGTRGFYWKPIQSGTFPTTDTEMIQEKTKLSKRHFFPESYLLTQPLSPHAAALIDKVEISLHQIALPRATPLIVEGAGGVMVPLNQHQLMIDLISHLSIPALVVARSQLGTINHTLLTLSQLRQREIPILGVVINGPKNDSNRQALADYGQVPILGEIEPVETIELKTLWHIFHAIHIDFPSKK